MLLPTDATPPNPAMPPACGPNCHLGVTGARAPSGSWWRPPAGDDPVTRPPHHGGMTLTREPLSDIVPRPEGRG